MMRLIGWFAQNHVAANLLMLFTIAVGLLLFPIIRQEPFPNVAFDLISVTVTYPGAAPDEVEEAICIRIEEAIHTLEGIKRIRSTATEGFGSVTAELARGSNRRRVLDEIRTRVDGLDTLPLEAHRPVVQELIDDHVWLSIAVYGDVDESTLRVVGEQLRDEISKLPDAGIVELVGVRPYEISIEVSETDLRRHALTFDDVVAAVRASSLDLSGGSLKTRSGEILLRTKAQAYRGPDFEGLVLLTRDDGTRLHLGEVARVVDGFAETDSIVRFDTKPAAMVRFLIGEGRQIVRASETVHAYLELARRRIPDGVELAIWADESEQLKSRRDLLVRNAGVGLILVVLVLVLFLPRRLAFWVSAGIPVSFFGALTVMAALDVSINMMSLFAFIVALGLVVDDAIIVGESIDRHQRSSSDPVAAAIAGARELAVPVVLAVLTTVLFLLPILPAPGHIAKIARAIPIVVIACLVFSLVESLLVLPAHLSPGRLRSGKVGPPALHPFPLPLRGPLGAALGRFVQRMYRPAVEWVLRWPYLTVSIAVSVLMVAFATLAGGWIQFNFMAGVESDVVSAGIVMREGTPAEITDEALRYLEERALALRDELDAEGRATGGSVFQHVLASVGDSPGHHDDFKRGSLGSHRGRVRIEMAPGDRRTISGFEVEERWRKLVGEIPGAVSLRFSGSDYMNEPPIEIRLSAQDPVALEAATEALKIRLAAYPGVREISDSLGDGKQEVKLGIRPEAEASGITLAELARQVRQGFHGEEAQRIQRGREDVPVVVRYPAEERRSLGDLETIRIRTPAGGEVPFSAVASAEIERGYNRIERTDRSRTVNVVADVDSAVANAEEVLAEVRRTVLPGIAADHPGVEFARAGLGEEEEQLLASLVRNWLLAAILAYALLAASLRSYAQPLVIFAAVPFGFVGALVGHLVLGLELSAFSLIGMVALTGVVVNDSLVYVDCANKRRAEGMAVGQALVEAGALRFRPIFLTSLTTFAGLLPLLAERSTQALWLKPTVASLAFGVVFATGITLLLVPAAYLILEQLTGLENERFGPAEPSRTLPAGSPLEPCQPG